MIFHLVQKEVLILEMLLFCLLFPCIIVVLFSATLVNYVRGKQLADINTDQTNIEDVGLRNVEYKGYSGK